jgi:hypothetical protein
MPEALRVFVASSSEQIETANAVAKALHGPSLDIHVWDKDVFEFSSAYIESLEHELDRADFAIVVMTGHDAARVRGRSVNLPRDNVIFELGLFVGRLGRERSFFVVEADSRTRIASDLSGVEPVTFHAGRRGRGRAARSLGAQMARVRRQMLAIGIRHKSSPAVRERQALVSRFSNSVAGRWWERMRRGDDDASALSVVKVEAEPVSNTLTMEGSTYDKRARPLAEWRTLATSVVLGARPRVYYQWEGEHDAARGETCGGGGLVRFEGDSGSGYFYDTNFARMKQGARTIAKSFRLYRCTPQEARVMLEPWSAQAQALLRLKLRTLKG